MSSWDSPLHRLRLPTQFDLIGDPTVKRTMILFAVVAIVVAAPLAIYASHRFQDVPNSHTFHEAISWLADNGITQGCNPPANSNYCPDNPVTRGQMAGFMKRFHDAFIEEGGSVGLGVAIRDEGQEPDPGNGVVDGLNLTLRIPKPGVLVVTGNVQMINLEDSDAFVCGINFGGPPTSAHPGSWRIVDLISSTASNCDTTAAAAVSPGNLTARVVVAESIPTSQALQGTLSAVLYTDDGSISLLSSVDEATQAPAVSDEAKVPAAG